MASHDDVQTWPLAVLGFFGVTGVVIIVLAMMVLYHHTQSRLEHERTVRVPFVELENALATQQGRLLQYQRVGEEEQGGITRLVYRIPIERAMEIVLREWRSGVLPGPAEPQATPAATGEGAASGKALPNRSSP